MTYCRLRRRPLRRFIAWVGDIFPLSLTKKACVKFAKDPFLNQKRAYCRLYMLLITGPSVAKIEKTTVMCVSLTCRVTEWSEEKERERRKRYFIEKTKWVFVWLVVVFVASPCGVLSLELATDFHLFWPKKHVSNLPKIPFWTRNGHIVGFIYVADNGTPCR